MAGAARLARSTSSTSSVSSIGSNASDDGASALTAAASGARANAITVAVRVRPPNAKELATQMATDIVRTVDDHIVAFDPLDAFGRDPNYQPGVPTHRNRKAKDLKFAFDRVFGPEATQPEVYEHTTRPLVDYVLDGYNATVFAYGATGAGKTHTMLGYTNDAGVMVLTMKELFQCIEQHRTTREIKVAISMLEVYNETIRDLLQPRPTPLDVREDPVQGIQVPGLSEHEPSDADEVLSLLAQGNSNRTVSATDVNATSSRSHAVLQIKIRQRDKATGLSAVLRTSKLSMIDLAGSERASATKNQGERLVEGANINRSLLALGNCINALGDATRKPGHVPYRDSKLTRLLKDSLGGNCRTVMIANVSPSASHYEDTLNTLKYANRAKEIKMRIDRNVLNVAYHVSQYTQIIAELRAQVDTLQQALATERARPTSAAEPVAPTSRALFTSAEFLAVRETLQRLGREYETLRELHGAVWAEAFLSDVQQWAVTASEHTPPLPLPSDPTSAEAHHQLQELTNKMSALEQQLEVTLTGLNGSMDVWEQDYLALIVSGAVTAARSRQTERLYDAMRQAFQVVGQHSASMAIPMHASSDAAPIEAEGVPSSVPMAVDVPAEPDMPAELAVEPAPPAEPAAAPTDAPSAAPATSPPSKARSSRAVSRMSTLGGRGSPYARRLRSTSDSSVTASAATTAPAPTPAPTPALAPPATTTATVTAPAPVAGPDARLKRAASADSRRQSTLPRRQTLAPATPATVGPVPFRATPAPPAPAPLPLREDGPAAGLRTRRQTMIAAPTAKAGTARPPLADVLNNATPTPSTSVKPALRSAAPVASTPEAATAAATATATAEAGRRRSMLPQPQQRVWR